MSSARLTLLARSSATRFGLRSRASASPIIETPSKVVNTPRASTIQFASERISELLIVLELKLKLISLVDPGWPDEYEQANTFDKLKRRKVIKMNRFNSISFDNISGYAIRVIECEIGVFLRPISQRIGNCVLAILRSHGVDEMCNFMNDCRNA